jgi:hypothetical protein
MNTSTGYSSVHAFGTKRHPFFLGMLKNAQESLTLDQGTRRENVLHLNEDKNLEYDIIYLLKQIF